MKNSTAKILSLDIETAPALAWTWGLHDVNIGVNQIQKDGYILMWSAKWYGEKKIMWDAVCNHAYPGDYSTVGEREITKAIWKLVDEADFVVTHNGDHFDLKHLNEAFLIHHLPPVSTFKSIDTLREARSIGSFISKKLEYLVSKFKLGKKIDTGGFELWKEVMNGKRSSWKKMIKYCCHDTRLEERIYKVLRPFMKTHPNLNVYRTGKRTGCSVCPSTKVVRKGFWISSSGLKYQRFICTSCGHNMRDKISDKPRYKGRVNAI